MSRLPSLTFCLLFALASACSDDDDSGPTDAGQDARRDGSSACVMADCQNLQRPRVSCPPPTVAEFSCVRTFDQKCTWGQERCAPGADGGATVGRRLHRRHRRRPGRRGSRRAGRLLNRPGRYFEGLAAGRSPSPLEAPDPVPWSGLAPAPSPGASSRTRGAAIAQGANPLSGTGIERLDPDLPRLTLLPLGAPLALAGQQRGLQELVDQRGGVGQHRPPVLVGREPSLQLERLDREVGAPQRHRPLAQGPVGPHLGGEPGQHVRFGQAQGRDLRSRLGRRRRGDHSLDRHHP